MGNRFIFTLSLLLLSVFGVCSLPAETKPNIVWVIADDMSAHFSCYGETLVKTPHLDGLAERGTLFTKAFVTAPVCSTNRSAFITGMYQTSIGAHQHRSGRGELKIQLPKKIKLIPQLFQEAGYHTSITSWPERKGKFGKTDYNFQWDQSVYDSSDWSERKPGQPFFAQVQILGGKLRGSGSPHTDDFVTKMESIHGSSTPLDKVNLPPYYPDLPELRKDWAAYLDSVKETDRVLGEVIAKLEQQEVLGNTIVLFMTDHGISHARGKQFCYEEGLHVPLVLAGPGVEAGKRRDDLVEHIDIAALSLGIAGIAIPDYMQAKDILAKDYQVREAVFAARDRCDETVDRIRSVRTQQYKYIRNYFPKRPHLQPNNYKDKKSIYIALREAYRAGLLNDTQKKLLFSPERSAEELYDLKNDPWELNNLANNERHAEILKGMRNRLDTWIDETGDKGAESVEMFDSDMKAYLQGFDRKKNPTGKANVVRNIELMKKWAAEGK